MNTTRSLHLLVLAFALGFSASAFAQDQSPASAPANDQGLLGENYFGANYAWYHFSDSPVDASGFEFEANYNVRSQLDFNLNYRFLRTDEIFGIRARFQSMMVGLRLFSKQSWGRPYLEASAGWAWADAGGIASEHSSAYRVGVGLEFQPKAKLTLTPFAYYLDYPGIDGAHSFNYGLKGNYWLSRHWALAATYFADDNQNTGYALGLNFRF